MSITLQFKTFFFTSGNGFFKKWVTVVSELNLPHSNLNEGSEIKMSSRYFDISIILKPILRRIEPFDMYF